MDAADVIVIGGGNAGLFAALAAAERKARVLLLERAPTEARGGNSAVTAGAFRFPYRGLEDIAQIVKDPLLEQPDKIEIGRYSEEDFSTDLRRVTQGEADPALGRTLVSQAFPTMQWLRGRGVEFVLAYDRQSFLVNGRHRFWGGLIIKTQGEGPGLVGALYRAAQAARVNVQYGARATGLAWDPAAGAWRVSATVGGRTQESHARAVVLACGGFEANPEMRAAHLGPRWKAAKGRGTPYNTGDGIRMGRGDGARPCRQWSGCHAAAWHVNAPTAKDRRLGKHLDRYA